MKAVNLYLLTRTHEHADMSLILESLSGEGKHKTVSAHEAASLWSLTDRLAGYLQDQDQDNWIFLLDGFFFSYVIEHIGKEFDLLKVSEDGGCILNIELKSEKVEEERIKKQLDQNRYFLSHIAQTICSFIYIMETEELYSLDDGGELRKCETGELIAAMKMDELRQHLPEGIENCFKAAEYLISPIANPEKFLKGKYFLTNQQFEFRRRILAFIQDPEKHCDNHPVISVSGIAGTGKTLLLLDVAVELSKNCRVLFIHSGPLRKGHLEIRRQLEGVNIISGDSVLPSGTFSGYGCVMVDEADHLDKEILENLIDISGEYHIPVVFAYDPHRLLSEGDDSSDFGKLITDCCSLSLSFTGNIRINRPVYSFLRTLLCLKDHGGTRDYSCIDVLYANDVTEQKMIEDYYSKRDYTLVSGTEGAEKEDDVIAREYDKVIMILDEGFYYDDNQRLRVRENEESALRLLYEGLSRTRENLCLLITGNRELFLRVLEIRVGQG